ncbi:MAG: hypothetical protein IPJ81_12195 [Chitinophagaceae bacterium]|nr:hypothetical protein [Chitinophagaceae bacterium]
MKKIIVYTLLIVFFGCNDNKNVKDITSNNTLKDTAAIIKKDKTIDDTVQQKTIVKDTTVTSVKVNKDSTFLSLNKEILTAVKNNDYKKFARFIHPIDGIRFSQYGYVLAKAKPEHNLEADKIFKPEEFLKKIKDNSEILWGVYDGSGDPILLTVKEYFKQFVYSQDFLNAEEVIVMKSYWPTNMDEKEISEIYSKDCVFITNSFPGFNKEYGGMDWQDLTLVLKSYQDNFYLIGIIDDRRTM